MADGRRGRSSRLDRALEECERDVMALDGVSGVALGEEAGAPRIIVYVERLTPELQRRIAREYHGVAVKVVPSGAFEAH
jgi:hypothetical protein